MRDLPANPITPRRSERNWVSQGRKLADSAIAECDWAGNFQSMSLSEILPNIRSLSAADKLRLIRLLAEEVDAEPDIAPLEHGRTYAIATPVFEACASEALLRELQNASQG
jgi:hypothetical protein